MPSYVQDMRLPGMVFGRAVRPPWEGARLLAFDEAAARKLPGVIAVVRDGSFLAVATTREEQAIAAMHSIKNSVRWSSDWPRLPERSEFPQALAWFAKEDIVVDNHGHDNASPPADQWIEASYSRPYL